MATTLTRKAERLVIELCREAGNFSGDLTNDQALMLIGDFYCNKASHEIDDLNDAAEGDVAALVRAREACGLPMFR
jgi:hypothetical protein